MPRPLSSLLPQLWIPLLSLGACHTALPSLTTVVDQERETALRKAYTQASAARIHARAILRVSGQESDFSLLFEAHPPAAITVAGLDDLGGSLFQAKRTEASHTVLRGSPLIPDTLILDGILEDLAVAFLSPPATDLEFRARADGTPLLRGNISPHDVRYLQGSGQDYLSLWVAGRRGRLERRIEVQSWSSTPAPHPLRMTIANSDQGYELLLQIVEWQPLQP